MVLLVKSAYFFVARLMRQMELDADRHEARLVGSVNFARTARSLRILQLCQETTFEQLDHYRRTERLPDNLPALMVDNENQVDMEKFRELEEKLLNVESDWSDSHPSDRDRIENAALENAKGVFTVEYPARVLFSDINSLCQGVTVDIYKSIFGTDFKVAKLKNTNRLIASRKVDRTEAKAALRFVMEQFCGSNTFWLPRPRLGKASTSKDYKERTRKRRKKLMAYICGYANVRRDEGEVWDELVTNNCAKRLMEAGFDCSEAGDLFEARTIQQAVMEINSLESRDDELRSRMEPIRTLLGKRLLDALEFLRAEKMVTACRETSAVQVELELILDVWNTISDLRPMLQEFQLDMRVTMMLLNVCESGISERMLKSVKAAMGRLVGHMKQVQVTTRGLNYPFEHGQGTVSLARYLVPKLPSKSNFEATVGAATDMDANLEYLLRRCVARLGALAEKVEVAFGFEPLEMPAELKQMMAAAENED